MAITSDATRSDAVSGGQSTAGQTSGLTLLQAALVIAALAAAAIMPLVLSSHLLAVAVVALLSCYMAQCWNIAAGYAGQFSLGHSVFFGIGAYTAAVLYTKHQITPWIGLFAGAALSALVGAAIAAIVF